LTREARPRAILFDWDNTLVDTWPVIHAALNATLEAFGHEAWTLAETQARVRRSLRDSFPGLFGARWRDAGDYFYERFAAIHIDALVALPGAGPMLAALDDRGLYLGVVSNKKGEYLRREAAPLGWEGHFGRLIGALDTAADKPARAAVESALSGSGIAAGPQVWFAGDTDIDMQCAVNAGCVPVLVRAEAPREGEFPGFAPARHVPGCLALSNLVLEL
jgi:phosphoglycolate phosphatase